MSDWAWGKVSSRSVCRSSLHLIHIIPYRPHSNAMIERPDRTVKATLIWNKHVPCPKLLLKKIFVVERLHHFAQAIKPIPVSRDMRRTCPSFSKTCNRTHMYWSLSTQSGNPLKQPYIGPYKVFFLWMSVEMLNTLIAAVDNSILRVFVRPIFLLTRLLYVSSGLFQNYS